VAGPVPPLAGSRPGPQQVLENLVILLRGNGFDGRGHLVERRAECVTDEPDLFFEYRAVERQEVGRGRADLLDRLTECHVVERDCGALVHRPVGPLLKGDLVDGAAHAGKRQRQHARQVARVQTAAVHGAGARLACREHPVPLGRLHALRMEHECRGGNVFPAGQQRADIVDAGGAGGVENADRWVRLG
jgi:hypothetical protein